MSAESVHRVTLRISFALSANESDLRAISEKAGSYEEWRTEAVERLRVDLEREIGDGWEPFDRSPFEIALSEEEC